MTESSLEWRTLIAQIVVSFLPREHNYTSAVFGVIILSLRPSVRLSHAWIVTKLNDALRIFFAPRKDNQSAILTLTVVDG